MKTQLLSGIYFAAALLCSVILFISCERDDVARLRIVNGFYADIPATGATGGGFVIQFNYYVTGQQCQVNGYGIKYDSTSGAQEFWYFDKTLSPGVIFTISDTFAYSRTFTTNPTVTMQGYRIGDDKSYPELRAQCVLLPRAL